MRKFFSEKMIPVAAPGFVREHNLKSPEDLSEAMLNHMSSRPSSWQEYMAQIGLNEQGSLTGKYFDQFSMVITAVKASLGTALLPRFLIEREIENGELVVLSDRELLTEKNYYFVTPIDQEDENVERFYQWMIGQVTDSVIGKKSDQ